MSEETILIVTDDTPQIALPDGSRDARDRGGSLRWGDEAQTEIPGSKGIKLPKD